jgi:hypothetical protein
MPILRIWWYYGNLITWTVISLTTARFKPLILSLSGFTLSVLYYDRRSVGQSVLVSSPHLGLMTIFLLLSDKCGFFDMGRPLWRADGSVLHNVQCTRYSIFYCLRFETRSLYLYPPGTGWPGYTPRHWVLHLVINRLLLCRLWSDPM